MTARKIDLMHLLYGDADGKCGDCPHFVSGRYHDRMLFKCAVYGLTHSEATDWRKKWPCCGMKERPLDESIEHVIDILKRNRSVAHVEPQIEGQIRMEDLL